MAISGLFLPSVAMQQAVLCKLTCCHDSQVLPGRTQNGVKNHWHATMRKVQRAPTGAAPQSPLQAYLHELRSRQAAGPSAAAPSPTEEDSAHTPSAGTAAQAPPSWLAAPFAAFCRFCTARQAAPDGIKHISLQAEFRCSHVRVFHVLPCCGHPFLCLQELSAPIL